MTAATDTPRQNALYLTPLGPRRALGFGVGTDVVPEADDLTPAAARARWHGVPAETSAPAVAHPPACLAQGLGNRPQPQTKRGSPASLESIAHIGTPDKRQLARNRRAPNVSPPCVGGLRSHPWT